ncbi:MAG: hypothetical protein IT373_18785 [Polyangiaceae bacterium]|nr:hypothetical protein [Polyangiaceae bacterium]
MVEAALTALPALRAEAEAAERLGARLAALTAAEAHAKVSRTDPSAWSGFAWRAPLRKAHAAAAEVLRSAARELEALTARVEARVGAARAAYGLPPRAPHARSADAGVGRGCVLTAVAHMVCAASLIGCNPNSGSTVKQTLGASAANCLLTVGLERGDAERLTLRYTFENHSDRSAYFFEEVEGDYRDGSVAPTRAHPGFVLVEPTGVILAKKIPTIPPDGSWPEYPTGPFATRVAPGSSESRVVEVELPLAYYNPHVSLDEDLKGSPWLAKLLGRDGAEQLLRMDFWFELGFVLLLPAGDAVLDQYDRCRAANGHTWYDFRLSNPERQTLLRVGPLGQAPVRSFAAADGH